MTKDLQLIADSEFRVSLKFDLQYSLRLIEASIDYLIMTNKEEENSDENFSRGTVKELIFFVCMNNESGIYPTKEMIKELLKDHERIITQLQKRLKLADRYNEESVDFIISMIEEHQNIAGKFRKYF